MEFEPDEAFYERCLSVISPWQRLTSPVFRGWENLPDDRPLLFVGNHTLGGVLDAPLLYAELWERRRIRLRSLGDHLHFQVPGWRELVTRFGVVDGTRENCAQLMEAGECILVFPGGAREVNKRRGERYKLIWGDRLGFARMAIQYGCTITPFAAVGAEEALDIVADPDQVLASPVGRWLVSLGLREDAVPPVLRGIGPTPIPRPVRMYFELMPAIETRRFAGRADDDEACMALRDEVQAAIEGGIDGLLRLRDEDPMRTFSARVGRWLERTL